MKRTLTACITAAALLMSACAADGADDAKVVDDTTEATSPGGDSTAPAEGDAAAFGDLGEPCGPGDATVAPEDAGRGTDKLYIAVANDRASIRTGLNQEMWDATTAFVDWCNDQGGVGGLPLEAIDVDGKLFELEAAMATTCADAFALVGGGWAQDNLAFSGKPDADFELCDMIAIAGFGVSPEFSGHERVVMPLPNREDLRPVSHFEAFAEAFPEETKNFGILYGGLPMMENNMKQNKAALEKIGWENISTIAYDPINPDWSVIAQQVKSAGLQSIAWVGEPQFLSAFSLAMKDQGWQGRIIGETNIYDERFLGVNGPDAVEGVVVRGVFPPFEEAADWPVVSRFLEIVDTYSPDWPRASLAVQSFSAALMFVTAANECAEQGPITRDCVLQTAGSYTEWTAGGLHPSGNPAENEASPCNMLLEVRGGKFERLSPELDGEHDDDLGLRCSDLISIG